MYYKYIQVCRKYAECGYYLSVMEQRSKAMAGSVLSLFATGNEKGRIVKAKDVDKYFETL